MDDTNKSNEKDKKTTGVTTIEELSSRGLTVQTTEDTRTKLLEIKEYYRSPSLSHTIRLMIEDVASMIKQPEVNVFARGIKKPDEMEEGKE